jgi:hypothetical protein
MIRKITTKKGETRYDVQVSVNHPTSGKRHFKRGRAKTKFEAQEMVFNLRQELLAEISGQKIPEQHPPGTMSCRSSVITRIHL